MSLQTATSTFTIPADRRGFTIAVDPASTGTLTIQLAVGPNWATLGVVPNGEARIIDASNVDVRCVVSGTVTYEVS